MTTHTVSLVDESSQGVPARKLHDVAQALQTQVTQHLSPAWKVHARVKAGAVAGAWPIRIVDDLGDPRVGGVHLDDHGRPYALVRAGAGWSITASHELLELLVDPFGRKFVHAADIAPGSDGHTVAYLVEVADPCEVFSYRVDGVAVSDFVMPAYYDPAARGQVDFLGRLARPFDVPRGCYLSWLDPEDGHWHQKTPDGRFTRSREPADPRRDPREDRDRAFADDARHDLESILGTFSPQGAAA
jgi:hypothetical protein